MQFGDGSQPGTHVQYIEEFGTTDAELSIYIYRYDGNDNILRGQARNALRDIVTAYGGSDEATLYCFCPALRVSLVLATQMTHF